MRRYTWAAGRMLAPMPPYIGWHRMGGIGGSGGYVWIFARHATRR